MGFASLHPSYALPIERQVWKVRTNSIWYGSPRNQIQAFRAFQIARELHSLEPRQLSRHCLSGDFAGDPYT